MPSPAASPISRRRGAAINYDNTILPSRDPASGEPGDISVELAREFARRLGVADSTASVRAALASCHPPP